MKTNLIRFCCLLALTLCALAQARTTNNPPATLNIEARPINREVRAPISFSPVIQRAAPSVVTIYSTMTIHERPTQSPFSGDPFLRRFFGDPSGPSEPRDRKAQGLGSGVIVSADGYILTANHVVEGADTVKVALADGEREFEAKVVGTDPPTDLAVLRIDAKKQLPAITLTDSDKLQVGDMVLAIGDPFAVGQTVTLGIISALQRGGFDISGYEDFIQTDAAINPGNSGGALVDVEGRLVGINTAILSRSGGFQGVGFAVPINMARYVMDRLITSGRVARGYLGINIQPLTPDLAKEFNLPDESSGVLVGGVSANSAAAKAGVEEGDVVVELNGKKVTDPRKLQLLVAETPPGSKVALRVLRGSAGGKPTVKSLTVTLAELPQEAFASRRHNSPQDGNQHAPGALEGVEVTDLDSGTRKQLDVPRSVQGALVVNVDPDSNAARAGLIQGDVLIEIDHKRVRNAEDAVALTQKVAGEHLLLKVWSRSGAGPGGTRYLVVDNSKTK